MTSTYLYHVPRPAEGDPGLLEALNLLQGSPGLLEAFLTCLRGPWPPSEGRPAYFRGIYLFWDSWPPFKPTGMLQRTLIPALGLSTCVRAPGVLQGPESASGTPKLLQGSLICLKDL